MHTEPTQKLSLTSEGIMNVFWTMPEALNQHFQNELAIYRSEMVKGNLSVAWSHLERGHIIGQPWLVE